MTLNEAEILKQIKNEYGLIKFLNQLKKCNNNLFLYGAGTAVSAYSKITITALKGLNIHPKGFVDDDPSLWGTKLLGISVFNPNHLEDVQTPLIVISSNYFEGIAHTLANLSLSSASIYSITGIIQAAPKDCYDTIISYEEVMRRLHTHQAKLSRIKHMLGGIQDNLIINALDVQVTERCTMKCKDCSNLMQYYEKPIDSDKDVLESSLIKILNFVEKISNIRIIGGEPFLYKELPSLFDLVIKSKKIERVNVYTNATFVPHHDVLIAMQHPKIEVEITDYDEHSRNHHKMIEVFKDYKIKYIDHKPQNWTDSARIVKNNKTNDQLAAMFDRCCVNDVLSLLHGKLYHCPFSANAHNLKAISEDSSDFIDLISIEDSELKAVFQKFYFGKPFQSACKSCLGRDFHQPKVIPAIQTKKPIPIPIYSI